MIGCHYLISGKVQGVGFRAYTQRAARTLGLVGWVRNLSDGRVEVLVLGLKSKKDEFEALLRIGPPNAKIERIESVVYSKSILGKVLTGPDFLLLDDGENEWSLKT